MNFNPWKRPDFKNQNDAELDETEKQLKKKKLISLGVNLTGALVCAYFITATLLPAILPAIPVFYGTTLIAIGICSSNRFSSLERQCRNEKYDRISAKLNQQLANLKTPAPEVLPKPAAQPAPAPAFNSTAATVLDEDLEINRPLQFKKKPPGASA